MTTISLAIDGIPQAQRLLVEKPKQLNRAVVRSLNDTADHVRAESIRRIGSIWNVKPTPLRRALVIRKAQAARLEATIQATGGRGQGMPLISFGARQTKPGVTYLLRKSGQRKLLRGAFIGRMPSGHRGVFSLQGGKRSQTRKVKKGKWAGKRYKAALPIREHKIISIKSMWQPYVDEVIADGQPYLRARMQYHVGEVLK